MKRTSWPDGPSGTTRDEASRAPFATRASQLPWPRAIRALSVQVSSMNAAPACIKSRQLMSDADQQHPRVRDAALGLSTLRKPIHGNKRQALFSDGSTSTIETALLY
jgi:hypothetical protein